MNEKEAIGYFLPEGILDYFDIKKVIKFTDYYQVDLEEKNLHPEQYSGSKLISKGFYEPTKVQDFPIRGKACYLQVKRRRWLNTDTGLIVLRDWSLVAKGTRMTEEFAIFLKGFTRYHTS